MIQFESNRNSLTTISKPLENFDSFFKIYHNYETVNFDTISIIHLKKFEILTFVTDT